MEKSIVGDLVGRRGIVYAPLNRAGVLLLFGRLLDEFDMLVEEIAADCAFVVARRHTDSGWEKVKIALAFKSSELSGGPESGADLLICWHHDWPACPVRAFELKSLYENNFKTSEGSGTNLMENSENADNISMENIMPGDAAEALAQRGEARRRFEKAIDDLDGKIKKIFPEST